jgi:hypothetical protein
MSKKPLIIRLIRKAGTILTARVLMALVALAFAASISVTPVMYQAQIGSYVSVVNGLLATDQGFSFASANSTGVGISCSAPIQFSNTPGTANTNVTKDHWVYAVQVNTTTGIASNQNFTVYVTVGSTTYGPVCIEGASTPTTAQIITCKFDVGATLPSSPYSFGVKIQNYP